MPRLPEKILTTEKILNPITLDGISLVPLMRQLAIVAKKMYDKYPGFCGLIPFGSRTKGLSVNGSDLDIMIVIKSGSRIQSAKEIIQLAVEPFGINDVDIFTTSDTVYQTLLTRSPRNRLEMALLTTQFDFSIDNALFCGIVVGPHRLDPIRELARSQPEKNKKIVIQKILAAVDYSLQHGKSYQRIPEIQKISYLQNQLRLWKRRLCRLLDYKEEI